MESYTIQIKVNAVLDIEIKAESLEEAMKIGKQKRWEDIIAKNVDIGDGQFKLHGVWSNDWNFAV